jgi:hypothetical protein
MDQLFSWIDQITNETWLIIAGVIVFGMVVESPQLWRRHQRRLLRKRIEADAMVEIEELDQYEPEKPYDWAERLRLFTFDFLPFVLGLVAFDLALSDRSFYAVIAFFGLLALLDWAWGRWKRANETEEQRAAREAAEQEHGPLLNELDHEFFGGLRSPVSLVVAIFVVLGLLTLLVNAL